MRKIHISDSNSKNTFVHFAPIKAPSNPVRAFGKEKVFSKRFIISGENSDYENLFSKYEEELPQILINEDPELVTEALVPAFPGLPAVPLLPFAPPPPPGPPGPPFCKNQLLNFPRTFFFA